MVFARQVIAHARTGDIVILMSTSGASPNVLAAAEAAHERGTQVWAMTGPTPNPLMDLADEVFCAERGRGAALTAASRWEPR